MINCEILSRYFHVVFHYFLWLRNRIIANFKEWEIFDAKLILITLNPFIGTLEVPVTNWSSRDLKVKKLEKNEKVYKPYRDCGLVVTYVKIII